MQERIILTTEIGLQEAINSAVLRAFEQYSMPTRETIEQPITQAEICEYLNITEPTLIRWKKKGKIPHLRVGSRILYEKSKVIEALRVNQMRRVA